MFIVFEGIDGSGKTSLSLELYKFLNRRGIKILWTKEPYSQEIIELLLKGNLDPWGETFLFLGDRSYHVKTLIEPKLKEGFSVISDRYYLSTLAYQGYGRGLDLNELEKLNLKATGGLEPDITFILDIEPKKALQRIKKSRETKTRFEEFSFLSRVREGFLKLAQKRKNTFVVDADRSFYAVFGEVLKILDRLLTSKTL